MHDLDAISSTSRVRPMALLLMPGDKANCLNYLDCPLVSLQPQAAEIIVCGQASGHDQCGLGTRVQSQYNYV